MRGRESEREREIVRGGESKRVCVCKGERASERESEQQRRNETLLCLMLPEVVGVEGLRSGVEGSRTCYVFFFFFIALMPRDERYKRV